MYSENAALNQAYGIVLTVLLVIFAVMVFLCLIRAIKGPKTADRIVAVKMTGTIAVVMIAILAVKMNEGYLADICIIYAIISFLVVMFLTKVYMGIYAERNRKQGTEGKAKAENKEAKTGDSITVD